MSKKEEFVRLMFARNAREAEHYKTVLEDHDIPVEIKKDIDEEDAEQSAGIEILVPGDLVEDAEHIIELEAALGEEIEHNFVNFNDDEEEEDDFDTYGDMETEDPDREIDLEELDEVDDDGDEEDEDDEEEDEDDEEELFL